YFPGMGKSRAGTAIYRLIEAGLLTRMALLVPLRAHGLEPGDDAVLLVLYERRQASDDDLAGALGLDAKALGQRLARLGERGLIDRHAAGPAVTLTEAGTRICRALDAHWSELEETLLGDLRKQDRKRFR